MTPLQPDAVHVAFAKIARVLNTLSPEERERVLAAFDALLGRHKP